MPVPGAADVERQGRPRITNRNFRGNLLRAVNVPERNVVPGASEHGCGNVSQTPHVDASVGTFVRPRDLRSGHKEMPGGDHRDVCA